MAAADFPPDLFALLATEPVRANVYLAVTLTFALTFSVRTWSSLSNVRIAGD